MVFVRDEDDKRIVKEMWMARGDDEVVTVNPAAVDEDGNIIEGGYTMQPGDILTLTLRQTPDKKASPILMQVKSAPGSGRIPIRSADTSDLDYGKYSADIELLTEDGLTSTIWPKLKPESKRASASNLKNFMICSEVT